MDTANRRKRQPFHETIIGAINRAFSSLELINLGELIITTEIPQGHDKIIEAWVQAGMRHSKIYESAFYNAVIADLCDQKAEAEKRSEEEQTTAAS